MSFTAITQKKAKPDGFRLSAFAGVTAHPCGLIVGADDDQRTRKRVLANFAKPDRLDKLVHAY
jgi:hypothetical protein